MTKGETKGGRDKMYTRLFLFPVFIRLESRTGELFLMIVLQVKEFYTISP